MTSRAQRIVEHLNERVPQTKSCSSQGFRYTVDTMCEGVLTLEQRAQYERDGFFVVRRLFDQKETDVWLDRFHKICNREAPRPPTMTVMRDVSHKSHGDKTGTHNITKIQNFEVDPVLFRYCTNDKILRYTQCFTGPDIRSVHTMVINKPIDPGTKSSRHPLHQDLIYFPFRPADRIVCSWTAMMPVHRQNGCLVVIPGSHRRAPGGRLLEHGYPDWAGGVNKMYHGIVDEKVELNACIDQLVHLKMETGDTVFFHPLLIHGSGANRTKKFRTSISSHFSSADGYFIDPKGTIQEKLLSEIEDVAEKRLPGFKKLGYTAVDIWRQKSRLVRGKNGRMR